jgi:drug/metabolite transporter (DMT)-like permease
VTLRQILPPDPSDHNHFTPDAAVAEVLTDVRTLRSAAIDRRCRRAAVRRPLALRVDASERVRGPRLAGLALGFAGVAALLGLDVGGDRRQLAGAAAVLAGAACYGAGALLVKRRLADRPPLEVVTASLTVSTLLLASFTLATAPARLPDAGTVLALLLLAVPCTAVAFVLYFELIATAGASRATVVADGNPAVAAAFGVALLGEPLTAC